MSIAVQNYSAAGYRAAGQSPQTRDISGYRIFDQGGTGAAHALAHRSLDNGQVRYGHRVLGEWLDSNSGRGSEWVHLHFHMAIFELELGEWRQAHARFLDEILPAAAAGREALTDAPALLWRLAMTAHPDLALPWQPLRRTALACMPDTTKPFVQMHNLLALAGAGDAAAIERWLQNPAALPRTDEQRLVRQFARALAALAAGFHERAGSLLQAVLPDITRIGGSHAQNGLFPQLAEWCAARAREGSPRRSYRIAA
jgi:hypothetical protein